MKRFNSIMFLSFTILLLSSCYKEIPIPESKLPSKSRTYLETHFPDEVIQNLNKQKDGLKSYYEVWLVGCIALEFFHNGDIKYIGKWPKIPDSTVPSKIMAFVKENHSSDIIIGWTIEKKTQKIQLQSALQVQFDKDDIFIKYIIN